MRGPGEFLLPGPHVFLGTAHLALAFLRRASGWCALTEQGLHALPKQLRDRALALHTERLELRIITHGEFRIDLVGKSQDSRHKGASVRGQKKGSSQAGEPGGTTAKKTVQRYEDSGKLCTTQKGAINEPFAVVGHWS